MRFFLKFAFLVCVLAAICPNLGFTQVMVKDINADSTDTFSDTDNPECTLLGASVFFVADDGIYGKELYKVDLAKGAILVKDLNKTLNGAGTDGSNPYNLIAMGTGLYFLASDGIYETALWKCTGTDIVLVKGFKSAHARKSSRSVPRRSPRSRRNRALPDRTITVVDNKVLYFTADDGIHGSELWKSDGTTAGTVMVKDINPNSDSGIYNMTVMDKIVYFFADNESDGGAILPNFELWRSDGTEAGTFMVKEVNGGGDSDPDQLTVIGKILFFVATENGADYLLFKSFGTENTTVSITGGEPYDANWLTVVGGTLYFSGTDAAYGPELWRTNGSEDATVMVKDINTSNPDGSDPKYLVAGPNNTLYFFASDGGNGSEFWKSDGTTLGTSMIKDINPGIASSEPLDPFNPVTVGTMTYFNADDGTHGVELWKTNGTPAGTALAEDIWVGGNSNPKFLTNCGGTLYFTADDGSSPLVRIKRGRELWKCAGTNPVVTLAADVNKKSSHAFFTDNEDLIHKSGTVVYFVANDGVAGYELWKSGGTALNTQMVADLNAGASGSTFYELRGTSAAMFFTRDIGGAVPGLYKTKGTAADTALVQYSGVNIQAHSLIDAGSFLYFTHINQSNKAWAVDGGTSGINTWVTHGSEPTNYIDLFDPHQVVNNVLYFSGRSNGAGSNLFWKIGAKAAAVEIVKAAGGSLVDVDYVKPSGTTVYFVCESDLWKLDATGKGVLVKDCTPAPTYPRVAGIIGGANGYLFFTVETANQVYEFWQTKGTSADTVQVMDLNNNTFLLDAPDAGVTAGTRCFFGVGEMAWTTDGTKANTKVLQDSKGNVLILGAIGEITGVVGLTAKLLFPYDDGTGTELWESDGTPANTKMVKDVNPFGGVGFYGGCVIGTTVYLIIDDGIYGRELWKK